MRLSTSDQKTIKETTQEVFGETAEVFLFGSRVDDTKRGGDIDLLVRLQMPDEDRQHKILQLVAKLQMRIGDQPIDVLVQDSEKTTGAVYQEALKTGIRL